MARSGLSPPGPDRCVASEERVKLLVSAFNIHLAAGGTPAPRENFHFAHIRG